MNNRHVFQERRDLCQETTPKFLLKSPPWPWGPGSLSSAGKRVPFKEGPGICLLSVSPGGRKPLAQLADHHLWDTYL